MLLCNVSLAMLDPLVAVKIFDAYHLLFLYMTCAVDGLLGFHCSLLLEPPRKNGCNPESAVRAAISPNSHWSFIAVFSSRFHDIKKFPAEQRCLFSIFNLRDTPKATHRTHPKTLVLENFVAQISHSPAIHPTTPI